jgi:mannose-6-phosphate isomerase
MTTCSFGGIHVTQVDISAPVPSGTDSQSTTLGETPYRYELVGLGAGTRYVVSERRRYCVYVLRASVQGVLVNGLAAHSEQYVLGDALEIQITCDAGEAKILLASQFKDALSSDDPLRVFPLAAAKRVEKPWGHEIWLTGDPSKVFAFKRILLKAGNKTSLQYHQYKRETNLLFSGIADLHYNPDPSVSAAAFESRFAADVRLHAPCVADVFPGTVHRLAAVEDLLLYEVSTPELDDVIRLADDTSRGSGRISDEHVQETR